MRIYWLNPPIGTRTLVADTGWMNFSAVFPEYEWIEPIINWRLYHNVDDVVDHIIESDPKILLLGSYIWNGKLCLDVAERVKKINPDIIIVRGGPQQPYFTEDSYNQFPFLDYCCSPLATGEYFFQEFLKQIQEHGKIIEPEKVHGIIMRGYTAPLGKQIYKFPEFSTYEYNMPYLINVVGTSKSLGITSVINMETTRGCPYSCTYCEWGGGIGTKISQKPTDIVFKEIDLVCVLGFDNIDFIDANFGILNRDPDIMQRIADNKKLYGSPKDVLIYGVAKTKIEKREKFLDIAFKHGLMKNYSLSVQSYSSEALKNVKRTDVTLEENLSLGKKFNEKYGILAQIEIIMGLPGYTLNDFYQEMDFTLYTKGWQWSRGPLTVLSGTEIETPFYKALHKIKTVNIGITENDDNDITHFSNCVLTKYKSPQEVVVETYSFSREDWKEMMFMNYAQRVLGPTLTSDQIPSVELKKIYNSIKNENWFKYIHYEIDKMSNGQRSDQDFLLYDGHLIEEWVTKFYLNKEKFNGSYN